MNPELRNVSVRQLLRALERDGFVWTRGTGGHRIYVHPDGRWVPVTFHAPGDTFPSGTLGSMLRSAGWTDADLRRLGLVTSAPPEARA